MKIALYKGPPDSDDWVHNATHGAIKLRTFSKYSHAELVIDGYCYSSSNRDGGVRRKKINLDSGRWDVFEIEGDEAYALEWFRQHEGAGYDWGAIINYVIPFYPHHPDKYVCFECLGEMLKMPNASKLTGRDFCRLYKKQQDAKQREPQR
jgi:hypothetical protein